MGDNYGGNCGNDDNGQCWSAVGNGPCNTSLPSMLPSPTPSSLPLPPAGRRLSHAVSRPSVSQGGQVLYNGQGWTLQGKSGTITFTIGLGSTAALAFGDVDADGDLDLIVANTNSPNELWINNGVGVFNRNVTFDAGGTAATTAVAFGDVNGDGALDLVFGNTNNQANTLLLNDGSGVFTVQAANSPMTAAASFPGGSGSTRAVAFGDIDGDGELDLLAGNGGANGGANELLMLTHCPDGGAQLHAGSSCFACPPSMGKSSPSVCLECVPDFVSEGIDGTLGPGCRKACVLAQRPLGSDSCQECKSVPGNVGARLTLTSTPTPNQTPTLTLTPTLTRHLLRRPYDTLNKKREFMDGTTLRRLRAR
eukprot:scaffold67663_cov67-Phaeocystis_antarctica.AAC.3